ncbi:hypothetical protein [Luethyella okanaganae]|uniref:Uncharacterized protein n=1 Tax=Luethyella okanaganae TaxID=69372 RepID=A0ABW1VL40_9MICO
MKYFVAGALVLTAVLVLAGCGGSTLPSFDEVRDETHVEMQKIVDRLPEGAVVRMDDPMPDFSYPCDGGVGIFYTGEWGVYVADGFGIQPWMDEVKVDLLADGYFEVAADASITRSFSLRAPKTDILLGVSNDQDAEQGARILVRGYSRCAQDPEPRK